MKQTTKLLLAGALAACSLSANATLITASENFSPVRVVDSGTGTSSLNFGVNGIISDVNVFVDFTKCDSFISSTGACTASGYSYNSEIVFSLTSAQGTNISLVSAGTYGGQTPGARVDVLFDDSALSAVGGSTLLSGSFSPVGSLADFNGEDIFGDWTLTFTDTVGSDPLSVNGWGLEIMTGNAPQVPEPMSLALLGLGLAGLGISRKKKRT